MQLPPEGWRRLPQYYLRPILNAAADVLPTWCYTDRGGEVNAHGVMPLVNKYGMRHITSCVLVRRVGCMVLSSTVWRRFCTENLRFTHDLSTNYNGLPPVLSKVRGLIADNRSRSQFRPVDLNFGLARWLSLFPRINCCSSSLSQRYPEGRWPRVLRRNDRLGSQWVLSGYSVSTHGYSDCSFSSAQGVLR